MSRHRDGQREPQPSDFSTSKFRKVGRGTAISPPSILSWGDIRIIGDDETVLSLTDFEQAEVAQYYNAHAELEPGTVESPISLLGDAGIVDEIQARHVLRLGVGEPFGFRAVSDGQVLGHFIMTVEEIEIRRR